MINHETLSPFTYRIIRNDGEVRYLRASGKMIKNLKNEKILLGITSDVTEEIENQKNISEKNRELEKKNRTLFLANETNKEAEIAGNYGTAQWFVKDNRFIFSDVLRPHSLIFLSICLAQWLYEASGTILGMHESRADPL
jgi:hypothetical protein